MKQNITTVESLATSLRLTEPTIADNGFATAVMAQLPRANELAAWKKNTLLLAATALGSAVVAWKVPLTAVPELLAAATADWLMLFGTAVMVTYSAAAAAVWTARKF